MKSAWLLQRREREMSALETRRVVVLVVAIALIAIAIHAIQ